MRILLVRNMGEDTEASIIMKKIQTIARGIWLFCSFLFVPQWGKNKANTNLPKPRKVELRIYGKTELRRTRRAEHAEHTKLLLVAAIPSSDVWPIRARNMKTGSVASRNMVIPTRNWRYSPRQ